MATPQWNPADWEEALGSNISDWYTPEQQFNQFSTGIRPNWQFQTPLRNLQSNLQQRHMLGYPGGSGQADEYNPEGFRNNFRDYLGQVRPGAYAQNPSTLRARAQEAANIANMTTQQLATDYLPGSEGFNRAAWYRQAYGGDDSLTNQRRLVGLLASQRPESAGGGEYSGRMGQAIQRMLSEVYNARVAGGDPGSNFLQWYLTQTAPEDQGS